MPGTEFNIYNTKNKKEAKNDLFGTKRRESKRNNEAAEKEVFERAKYWIDHYNVDNQIQCPTKQQIEELTDRSLKELLRKLKTINEFQEKQDGGLMISKYCHQAGKQ